VQKYPISRLYYCPNRAPRPGFKPEPNGCGTKEHPVQAKFGLADFTAACNAHDTCYDTCNSGERICDDKFYEAMKAECARAYPVKNSTGQKTCLSHASDYRYGGGIGSKLLGAYDDAQSKACQCCADEQVGSLLDLFVQQDLVWETIFFGDSASSYDAQASTIIQGESL